VRQLVGAEIVVDAGVVEPGALAGAARLDVARVVLHEDRVVIEALQARATQVVRQPVGAPLQLRIADALAAAGHDERRLLRPDLDLHARIHRSPPASWPSARPLADGAGGRGALSTSQRASPPFHPLIPPFAG